MMTFYTRMTFRATFLAFTALIAVGFASEATAQDAPPPESQLVAPMGDMPAPNAAALGVPSIEKPSDDADSGDAPHVSNGKVDPCPAPEKAAGDSPDDLAKVQEDIDRFTLCVQRAQLLERYNDSVLKNDSFVDTALGYQADVTSTGIPSPQRGMAPLPANALAGADVSPAANSSNVTPTESAPEAAPEEPKTWTISQVYGASADMQAKLLSPDGDEVKVRAGSKLPDGAGTVARVTPSGVTIRQGSDNQSLEWARE